MSALKEQEIRLKIQRGIRQAEDDLVTAIQTALNDRNSYGDLEESQFRNLVRVSDTTESAEVIKNFLRYQVGREEKWGRGQNSLAAKIVQDIDKFRSDSLSGKITLRLTVTTTTFVASGLTVLGSDLSSQTKNIPLVKTSIEQERHLVIPGSSLKGVIRATYEAITRSCLCKVSTSYRQGDKTVKINSPKGYQECKVTKEGIRKREVKVCPACQISGAIGWQGLVHLTDARCERIGFTTGFMPSLYSPNPQRQEYYTENVIAGRKFYYHFTKVVDEGERGIDVQQAGTDYTFATCLSFMNLTKEQLGTLLIVLGQDSNHRIALKVGGGKPIGMGTMTVDVLGIEIWTENTQMQQDFEQIQNLRNRYSSYKLNPEQLAEDALQHFMQAVIQSAHDHNLVQAIQLAQLVEVLGYPTNREPQAGMY